VLYLATISVDAARKLAGLPSATVGIVYLLAGLTYLVSLRRPGRSWLSPRSLPVWLTLLSVWCAAEAAVQRVPAGMALLGWASYVFFVPLFYVGAGLMATDQRAARALRVVVVAGGLVGLAAVASALLGQAAPALLQPFVASAGIHTFGTQNVYLAPSVFATAEEASEHLLIALFALAALAHLPASGLGRGRCVILGTFITAGLLVAARRADLYVAVAGIVGLALLGFAARPRWEHRAVLPGASRRGRLGPVLALAAATSVTLLLVLGAGKLVPFLTSGQGGTDALRLMFSPAHPAALAGQGPGTSTQGASVVGATSVTAVGSQGPYAAYTLGGRSFLTAEGGLTKTWLELGLVGAILYGGVFACVLAPAIRRLGSLDGTGRALTGLAIALGIVFLKGHQSLDNPLVQPLFWLAAGGAWGRLRPRTGARGAAAGTVRPVPGPPRPPGPSPALTEQET
jgi:hypothetical protein